MEAVINCVVDTQLKLYNTSWLKKLEAIIALYTWYRQPGQENHLCLLQNWKKEF